MLALRDVDGRRLLRVPSSLIQEAINALPDESKIRPTLISWLRNDAPRAVPIAERREIEVGLAEFAHADQSGLGKVGRRPEGAAGRIVPSDGVEGVVLISATAVLALALRTISCLQGIGDTVVAGEQETVP